MKSFISTFILGASACILKFSQMVSLSVFVAVFLLGFIN